MSAADKIFAVNIALYAWVLVLVVITIAAFTAPLGTWRYAKLHEKRWGWLKAVFTILTGVTASFLLGVVNVSNDPQQNAKLHFGLVLSVVGVAGLIAAYVLEAYFQKRERRANQAEPPNGANPNPSS